MRLHRGIAVVTFIGALDLSVCNDPTSPLTFENSQGKSWMDITLSRGDINIEDWTACGTEAGRFVTSHRLLQYEAEINRAPPRQGFPNPRTALSQLNKANWGNFQNLLRPHQDRRCPEGADEATIDREVDDFTDIIRKSTKQVTPLVEPIHNSWWDEECETRKTEVFRAFSTVRKAKPWEKDLLWTRKRDLEKEYRDVLKAKRQSHFSNLR